MDRMTGMEGDEPLFEEYPELETPLNMTELAFRNEISFCARECNEQTVLAQDLKVCPYGVLSHSKLDPSVYPKEAAVILRARLRWLECIAQVKADGKPIVIVDNRRDMF